MTCPTCGAPNLIYQTPTLYLCGICGGYASLVGTAAAPPKPEPPVVTAKDFKGLDERLKKYRKP